MFELIPKAMVERRVGKLLHGGDWARDGRRRRLGPVSSEVLSSVVEVDLRWVVEKRWIVRSIPTRYLKSNSEAVLQVAKAVPLPVANR
jgi:hypothetical protein